MSLTKINLLPTLISQFEILGHPNVQLEANINADIEMSLLHDGVCYVCVRVAFEPTILIVFPKAIRINR